MVKFSDGSKTKVKENNNEENFSTVETDDKPEEELEELFLVAAETPKLKFSILGKLEQFEGGSYITSDPEKIAAIYELFEINTSFGAMVKIVDRKALEEQVKVQIESQRPQAAKGTFHSSMSVERMVTHTEDLNPFVGEEGIEQLRQEMENSNTEVK